MDGASLDFSEAFDTVPHSILLDKLSSRGMSRHTVHCAKNQLGGRAPRVVVKGATSGWRPLTSPVPWGSVLGPALSKLSTTWMQELNSPLASLLMIPNREKAVDCPEGQGALQRDLDRWSTGK